MFCGVCRLLLCCELCIGCVNYSLSVLLCVVCTVQFVVYLSVGEKKMSLPLEEKNVTGFGVSGISVIFLEMWSGKVT